MTTQTIHREGDVYGTAAEWHAMREPNWQKHSTQPLWLGVLAILIAATAFIAAKRRRKMTTSSPTRRSL
jgi:LPXTG-motif cell wall-anchored protein